jgi:hypothetical protein
MSELLLILAAIAILVVLIRAFRGKKREEAEEIKEEDVFEERSLDEIDTGGVLSILGTDYVVEERNRYTSAGNEWYDAKLTGDDNEAWWLGWDDSDDVSLTAEVDFAALEVSPDDLEAIADEGQGQIEYDGETYVLSEASEANYHRGGDPQGDQMYYWDFHDSAGEKLVGVVLWASQSYNAFVGSILPRSQVEILRASGDDDVD